MHTGYKVVNFVAIFMSIPQRPDIQAFLANLQFEKRYSEHTMLGYRTDLRDFFDFLGTSFGAMPLADIRHIHLRSWLAELKEGGLSSRSINRKISSLKSFFRFHLKQGTISEMPTGQLISPKTGKRLPVFVKENETGALVDALNASAEDWKGLNARLIFLILYNTGIRVSELTGLKESQVDFARAQIKVLGKGNKERIIPASPELLKAIAHYQAERRRLFTALPEQLLVTEKGRKLYSKYVYLLVNHYLGFAGTLDKKSPHVLRHSFATHLMNHGADLNAVKELLGHASLAATQVYTHNSIEKLKEVHRKAHPKA